MNDARLLVGASRSDANGPAAVAFVFESHADGWRQTAQLSPSDGGFQDNFGAAVALSGRSLLIGAPFDNGIAFDSGSVYAFALGPAGWSEVAKLRASDEAQQRQFGTAVAIDGRRAAIGAPGPVSGIFAGCVYLFERTGAGWSEVQRIQASDGNPADRFGFSLALEGDRLVVGAPDHTHDGATLAGSAYVFEHTASGWTQTAELRSDDTLAGDLFGGAVDLLGNTIAVGAEFASYSAQNQGAGYVFELEASGWAETARLVAPDAQDFDQLGASVLIVDRRNIALGVHRDDDAGSGSGSVSFFRSSGGAAGAWNFSAKMVASDGTSGAHFGRTLAGEGGVVVAAAPFDEAGDGSAYVLAPFAGTTSYCDTNPNSSGQSARLSVEGSLFLPNDETLLTTTGCPAGSAGIFIFAAARAHVPFGDGTLCLSSVSGGIHRLAPSVTIDPSGIAILALQSSTPARRFISAGSTWNFQFWFRDRAAAGGSGFNLSDGVEARFCP